MKAFTGLCLSVIFCLCVSSCEKDIAADPDLPGVETEEISAVRDIDAVCVVNVKSEGASAVTERGVCWAEKKNPLVTDFKLTAGAGPGRFSVTLEDLKASTLYYLRSYAINAKGVSYGEQKSFTTLAAQMHTLPRVQTDTICDLTESTATCFGNISEIGDTRILQRGICWDTLVDPTIDQQVMVCDSSANRFSVHLQDLKPGKTYFYRAFAKNKTGVAYGPSKSFLTKSFVLSTVTITRYSDVSFDVLGLISSNDPIGYIEKKGFCYGLEPFPTVQGDTVISVSPGTMFSLSITKLQMGRKYYVRSFIQTSAGKVYYSVQRIVQLVNSADTIVSLVPTNIGTDQARLSARFVRYDTVRVSEKGFCWSRKSDPDIQDSMVVCNVADTLINTTLSGLLPATRYFIRAYANTSQGVKYGNQVSFKTLSGIPVFHLEPIRVLSPETALGCGVLDTLNGAVISEVGALVSRSTPINIDNARVIKSTLSKGGFYVNLDSLQRGTRYYVMLYVKTSMGLVYGVETPYVTPSGVPVCKYTSITSLKVANARITSTLTEEGGVSALDYGFVYGTSSGPTVSDRMVDKFTIYQDVTHGQKILYGDFYSLKRSTKYYARPFVVNQYGVHYGSEVSFETPRDTVSPGESYSYMVAPNSSPFKIPLSIASSDGRDYVFFGDDISLEVVWQDNSAIAYSAVVYGKGPTAYVEFTPGGVAGNLILAARVRGVIQWSWHIWITSYNPELPSEQIVLPGSGKIAMKRNLGALRDSYDAVDLTVNGLMYQWGRKDAFPDTKSALPIYPEGVSVGRRSGMSQDVMINNPLSQETSSAALSTWNMWRTVDGKKTVYDPCPLGWRIPTAEELKDMGVSNMSAGTGGWSFFTGGFFPYGAAGAYWTSSYAKKEQKFKSSAVTVQNPTTLPDLRYIRCVKE